MPTNFRGKEPKVRNDKKSLQYTLKALVNSSRSYLSDEDYDRIREIPIKIGMSANMRNIAHVYPYVNDQDEIVSFRMSFNPKYLAEMIPEEVDDTMYHEFAHVVTMIQGTYDESHQHNQAFWDVMETIGADETPETTNSID